ncbi:MAG: hypothetical protein KAG37_11840 [Flavobacteriales bacterium]|nr:hypothetical protein [Flavobacteriales bacterium]
MRKNIYIVFMVIVSFALSFLSSCGATKTSETGTIILIPEEYTREDIEFILRDNDYVIEVSNPNEIITAWRKTKVELTTFKVEIIQGIGGWKMKGRVKYEAYRDREMDQSVYTEEYVFSNSDIFVISYGWDMLTKIEDEIIDDFKEQ